MMNTLNYRHFLNKLLFTSIVILIISLSIFTYTVSAMSNFSLEPLKIEFADNHAIQTVVVTNNDNKPLNMRFSAMRWQQKNAQDLYTNTNDLLISPPIVTIQPKQQQVVRIALRSTVSAKRDTELAYRLYAQEIPQAKNVNVQEQNATVNLIMRMALSVYVAPTTPIVNKINWQLKPVSANKFRLVAKNNGNIHNAYNEINLVTASGKSIAIAQNIVMLAGNARQWDFTLADENNTKNLKLALSYRGQTSYEKISVTY